MNGAVGYEAKILRVDTSERKYRWSGCVSKMSEDIYALPVLGDAEILAVKHLPLEVIPQVIQRLEDDAEGSSAVVAEEPLDVLKEHVATAHMSKQPLDFKEERTAGVSKPFPLAGDGKGLARKSSTDEIKVWEGCGVDGGDVTKWGMGRKVMGINGSGMLVDFGVADAGPSRVCPCNPQFEPSDAGKEAEVPHGLGVTMLVGLPKLQQGFSEQ